MHPVIASSHESLLALDRLLYSLLYHLLYSLLDSLLYNMLHC
jgi:hypothetical protein